MTTYQIIEKRGSRFIVQSIRLIRPALLSFTLEYTTEVIDIQEFHNLEDAKNFKRDLQLDEGIIVG